jgi:hypothetical protein
VLHPVVADRVSDMGYREPEQVMTVRPDPGAHLIGFFVLDLAALKGLVGPPLLMVTDRDGRRTHDQPQHLRYPAV